LCSLGSSPIVGLDVTSHHIGLFSFSYDLFLGPDPKILPEEQWQVAEEVEMIVS